jgi:short-subunit dehydrogenase
MMQAAVAVMQRQTGGGTIINVASLAGRRGMTPLGGYCATKFALVGLTEALRTELGGSHVHVGLVLPGVVDTPMAERAKQNALVPTWPSLLTMPPEWVAVTVLLVARFRLREVSVPPGAATMELLGALAPTMTDALIRWSTAAGRLLARVRRGSGPSYARASKRRRPAHHT